MTKRTKTISVIMLTYNRVRIVSRMIEGILDQSHRDFEYIIIDNGSTDNTPDLLRSYEKRDNRVKAFSIIASSIGRARNIGLSFSKGDLIAYVDDDDMVEPDFLEFLLDLIEENDADISMCGATEGDGITRTPQCLFNEKYVLTGVEAVKMLIDRKYIRNGTATKLYKREILEKYPFVENYRNEDLHTQYKYLLEAKKVAIHGLDKYYITRHDGNVSGFTSDPSKWNERTIRDYLDAYRHRTEYIKDKAPDIFELARYSEWSLMVSMLEKINQHSLADCEEIRDRIRRELFEHSDEFLRMAQIKPFEIDWMNKYVL